MKSISMDLPHVLEVRDLTVSRSGKVIIDDVDLTVQKGEFVGIVGPNGSGKSTLLLAILGILKPKKGDVRIYGATPLSKKLDGKIGWVSQAASNLPNQMRITVEELVKLGTCNTKNMFSFMNRERKKSVDDAIRVVGLKSKRHIDISRLSGGQRQRAVIARALASDADFIILDEPLVGIDRKARNSLLRLLDDLCHKNGKTILMVSHDLTAIRQTAHRMIYLEEGIQFDGLSKDFPSLDKLANLRGIKHVHENHKDLELKEEE